MCSVAQLLMVVVIFAIPFLCWEELMYRPFLRSITEGVCEVRSLGVIRKEDDWVAVLSVSVETQQGTLRDQHFQAFDDEERSARYASSMEGQHTCFYVLDRAVSLSYYDLYFGSYVPFVMYTLTAVLLVIATVSTVQFGRHVLGPKEQDVELSEYRNLP